MTIVLLIKTEDEVVSELPILSKVVLGRSGSSDFKVSDSKMSGSHCAFEVNPGGELLFTDLGSTNGSFLNNSQVQKTLVRLNDVIRIGNTLIKIDERKLTPSEKLALGAATKRKREKTLPDLGIKTNEKGTIVKKKSILVSKSKDADDWGGKIDNVIDREESSGNTRILTLSKEKEKKK